MRIKIESVERQLDEFYFIVREGNLRGMVQLNMPMIIEDYFDHYIEWEEEE
tara:strand:- start:1071 stop:1223 length:153 start_codon:yes stop_codon:yes gene_type:complete